MRISPRERANDDERDSNQMYRAVCAVPTDIDRTHLFSLVEPPSIRIDSACMVGHWSENIVRYPEGKEKKEKNKKYLRSQRINRDVDT